LHIDAFEDHVSLQYKETKGDLVKDKYGRKHNTIMPRLIYVYEGIEKEAPKSKRNKLTAKQHFGRASGSIEELWDEVEEYIDETYDRDVLEKIYIKGDGAEWIKKGLEVLGAKTVFVLDKYHLNKYILQATSHLEADIKETRQAIYDAFSFEDKEDIRKIFKEILAKTQKETKKEAVKKSRTYILKQWEGIIIKNDDPHARLGCSAESHISHIYSARLSSRPLGWSELGVDKMARLRVYKANGGKIYDLIKYKEEKEKRVVAEEIRKSLEKEIKRKRQKYNNEWNAVLVGISSGKRDGLRVSLKALRGICGWLDFIK